MEILRYKQNWDYHISYMNVFQLDGEYIGSYGIEDASENVNITGFYINEKYRNNGYGNEILSDMVDNIQRYEEVYLMVRYDNIIAINMYKKVGFKECEDCESSNNNRYLWMVRNK